MGWSKVKKALNSTLGTDEFKPLDKLIMGNKALKASDNFYGRVLDSHEYGDYYDPFIIPNLIVMNWSGSCKFKFYAEKTSGSGETIRVLRNGIIVDSTAIEKYDYSLNSSGVITFKKGDIIGLQIECAIEYADMYADVTDMSAFTILEV